METGTGGHVFPDDARGFQAQGISDVYRILSFHDEAEGAERGEYLGSLRPVLFGIVEVRDEGKFLESDRLGLWCEGLAVIDDVVGSEFAAPIGGFRAGGGGDDRESGGFRHGDECGADSARAVDDEDGLAAFRGGTVEHTLEQELPRGQGDEREGGCFGESESGRFFRDEGGLHGVKFRVRSGSGDIAGIVDFIAG